MTNKPLYNGRLYFRKMYSDTLYREITKYTSPDGISSPLPTLIFLLPSETVLCLSSLRVVVVVLGVVVVVVVVPFIFPLRCRADPMLTSPKTSGYSPYI